MLSLTKGSFFIPLTVAGSLSIVGAASYLFIVGEIAPLKSRKAEDPSAAAGADRTALARG